MIQFFLKIVFTLHWDKNSRIRGEGLVSPCRPQTEKVPTIEKAERTEMNAAKKQTTKQSRSCSLLLDDIISAICKLHFQSCSWNVDFEFLKREYRDLNQQISSGKTPAVAIHTWTQIRRQLRKWCARVLIPSELQFDLSTVYTPDNEYDMFVTSCPKITKPSFSKSAFLWTRLHGQLLYSLSGVIHTIISN